MTSSATTAVELAILLETAEAGTNSIEIFIKNL